MDEEEIIAELLSRRRKDLSYEGGRILSNVLTKPLDVAVRAYEAFMDVNALDVHSFPEIERIEQEVIGWLSGLYHKEDSVGYLSTGGTESNLAALWVAKKREPGKKKVLIPCSAHYSLPKAADLMDLEVVWVPLDEKYQADLGFIEDNMDDSVLAVVATAGTSALGVVDPIEGMAQLCADTFFHVDAAFGGFVLPFLDDPPGFDFSLQGVDSITVDPHKMGLAPLPSGAILLRDESYLEGLGYSPAYLSSRTWSLSGSRSGGSIAATWATIRYLGFEGYKRIVGGCMENTHLLCSGLVGLGVPPLIEPDLNFVALKAPDPRDAWERLSDIGWNILLDSELLTMRIVVMPHVTSSVIRDFLSDLEGVI